MFYPIIIIHFILLITIILNVIFTTEILSLFLLDFILFTILIMNIFYGICPITIIELDYYDKIMSDVIPGFSNTKISEEDNQKITEYSIIIAMLIITTKISIGILYKSLCRFF